MPDLERCGCCDARFDPASLDELIFHSSGSCVRPDGEMPDTGIHAFRIDEPPQG